MADYVTDTHALIWYLENDKRLGPAATAAYDDCDQGRAIIHIPTICLVELVYLQEKSRLSAHLRTQLDAELAAGLSGLVVAPLTIAVVDALARIARSDVPEMADRIIAATAFHMGLPLITKDHQIQRAGIQTIW